MLRSSCNCIVDTLGGILALTLFGAGIFMVHEVMLPSGRGLPWGKGEVTEKHTVSPYVLLWSAEGVSEGG